MNKSRRHHYVPEFITKHFSNDNGQIYVYDKILDKIYESNSKNLFVEKDRNTFINLQGNEGDEIEKIYSSMDSIFGGVLSEITKSNNITSSNFKILLLLAYISKWRVPQYDESFQNAKKIFSIDELGLGFKDKMGKRINFNLENHFQLEMHQELKRLFLAIQPFRFKEDFKILLENSFIISTQINSFISDCPFNEATITSDRIFEDFVFPITKDLTLVFSKRINVKEIQDFLINGDDKKVSKFLIDFSSGRDVSMLHLAERNVACCDASYLKNVTNVYKQTIEKNNKTAFNLTVFNVLYNFKEYINK